MASSWSEPTSIVAIANGGVALLYTIVTTAIWRATAGATKATWRALEAGQRPYVGVTRCDLVISTTFNGEITIAVGVQNVGSTPARRIEIDCELSLPNNVVVGKINSGVPQIALFPDQHVSMTATVPREYRQIVLSSSNGEFRVAIEVRYQGITEKQYSSNSAYGYNGIEAGFALISGHFE